MGRADNGISSPYGYSPGYKNGKVHHNGTDYYYLNADPAASRWVLAVGDGVVSDVYWSDVMGGCVTVEYPGVQITDCHMPKDTAWVSVGDRVTPDTTIGPMGNSGTAAGGEYHLHMEARPPGSYRAQNNRVDPEPYFTNPAGGDLKPINDGDETMARYIWTDQDGTGYALLDPAYTDGCILTADVNIANNFSYITAGSPLGGAPVKLPRKQFDAECAAAVFLWRNYAPKNVGSTTDNKPVLEAIAKVPTATQNGAAARAAIVKG